MFILRSSDGEMSCVFYTSSQKYNCQKYSSLGPTHPAGNHSIGNSLMLVLIFVFMFLKQDLDTRHPDSDVGIRRSSDAHDKGKGVLGVEFCLFMLLWTDLIVVSAECIHLYTFAWNELQRFSTEWVATAPKKGTTALNHVLWWHLPLPCAASIFSQTLTGVQFWGDGI